MKPIIPVMRTALEQIQELHKPVLNRFGATVCSPCNRLHPCATRKLADAGLVDRMARTNQGENK